MKLQCNIRDISGDDLNESGHLVAHAKKYQLEEI